MQTSQSFSHGSRNSINATTTAAGTAKRLNNILHANKKASSGDDNFSSSVLQTVFALVRLKFIWIILRISFLAAKWDLL